MKCKKLKKQFEDLVKKAKLIEEKSDNIIDLILIGNSELIYIEGIPHYFLKT